MSAFYDAGMRLDLHNRVESVVGTAVDTGFLKTLGVAPERGRVPTPREIADGKPYVVISHRLWHAHLADDPGVIGRSLELDHTLFTVVGVLPPRINYGVRGGTDAWIPLPVAADTGRYFFAFAWLRPGVSLAQARAEVEHDERPNCEPRQAPLLAPRPVRQSGDGGAAHGAIPPGAAALSRRSGLRAAHRVRQRHHAHAHARHGTALRHGRARVVGGGSGRLIRQSLTESLVLAGTAAVVGALLSVACVRLTTTVIPTYAFPTWLQFGVDTHVLLFVIALAAATVLLVGLTPAIEGTRFDVTATLKSASGGGATSARTLRRGQRAIVVQVVVAVALMITATLLGVSYRHLMTVDLGYHPEKVLSVMIQTEHDRYQAAAIAPQLSVAIAADPAVREVARTMSFDAFQTARTKWVGGDSLIRDDDGGGAIGTNLWPRPRYHAVSDNYFAVLGIPLLRGRTFATSDTAGTPLVVVISQRLAQAAWGGHGDVGRTLRLGRAGPLLTVIGVAGDVHDPLPSPLGVTTAGHPDLYFSERQAVGQVPTLLIRPRGGIGAATQAITTAIRTNAPEVNGFIVRPYLDTVSEQSNIVRIFGAVIGSCALIALALSLVGIYGVVGYGVAQRTREIGIRMALGGTNAQIRAHVMRGGMRKTAIGLVIGALLAVVVARLLHSFLLGVSAVSPGVYLAVAALFGAAALASGYIPSRRATKVDPMNALRTE